MCKIHKYLLLRIYFNFCKQYVGFFLYIHIILYIILYIILIGVYTKSLKIIKIIKRIMKQISK